MAIKVGEARGFQLQSWGLGGQGELLETRVRTLSVESGGPNEGNDEVVAGAFG